MEEITRQTLSEGAAVGGMSASENDPCLACAPKTALTIEEERILSRMREVKEQVRSINDRLKEIAARTEAPMAKTPGEEDPEWKDLMSKLDDLRSQWKDWQMKLEQAIERKLIMLGHREDPAGMIGPC